MKKSIYSGKSQEVQRCLERAGGPEKIMVVAMDMAKAEHCALLCNGSGEYFLKKPIPVFNNQKGVNFLFEKIDGIIRRRGIERGNVIVGAEDPPHWAYNFIHAVRQGGYPFISVNAKLAKTRRQKTRASSDAIDSVGIAQVILEHRGRTLLDYDRIYAPMKEAARTRRKLVREETACKNRIHRSTEILCPGFLDESLSGLNAFTQGSLDLMERNFSCLHLRRAHVGTLARRLGKHRVEKPERVAEKIKALAEAVIPPPKDLVDYEMKSLQAKVKLLRAIRGSIVVEENQMARALVQTPGFFLTSIPGMGVVLSGHITAEYGPTDSWPPADNMASYFGIIPRQTQTGGSAKPAQVTRLPMDANRIGKDYLLQAAFHVGTTGNHRLQKHYARVQARGGRERLSTAKLLLRIARKMVQTEMVYLPEHFLKPPEHFSLPSSMIQSYFEEGVATLKRKWKSYDLSGIPEQDNRLIQWENDVERTGQILIEHQQMSSGAFTTES